MFKREIISELMRWKNSTNRKPLILSGARQVGKTWVLKEFGAIAFDDCVYFSLDKDKAVCQFFKTTKDAVRIVEQLSYLHGRTIQKNSTLIIFDEIQECPEALQSLKYFCEDEPEYAVVCAGSLLGVYLNHPNQSFPVGKVDHIDMYPLSFREFLQQKDPILYNYYNSINTIEPIPDIFFDKLRENFTAFCISGGMPEPAMEIVDNGVDNVDRVINNILKDYSSDFVKHTTPIMANKIDQIWKSLPSQLAKENRKFIYQLVKTGARAREYEDALFWLERAGLVYKVNAVNKIGLPIKAYDDLSAFKLYCLDLGLLRVLAEMDMDIYLTNTTDFFEFKGALAENYVLQSLVCQYNKSLSYWTSGNLAEVDFILVNKTEIIPIEVKAYTNTVGKSLIQYQKLFEPRLRIRFSMKNLNINGNLINIPLFLADKAREIISLVD